MEIHPSSLFVTGTSFFLGRLTAIVRCISPPKLTCISFSSSHHHASSVALFFRQTYVFFLIFIGHSRPFFTGRSSDLRYSFAGIFVIHLEKENDIRILRHNSTSSTSPGPGSAAALRSSLSPASATIHTSCLSCIIIVILLHGFVHLFGRFIKHISA